MEHRCLLPAGCLPAVDPHGACRPGCPQLRRFGQAGGIPRRLCPILVGLREEVVDGQYALVSISLKTVRSCGWVERGVYCHPQGAAGGGGGRPVCAGALSRCKTGCGLFGSLACCRPARPAPNAPCGRSPFCCLQVLEFARMKARLLFIIPMPAGAGVRNQEGADDSGDVGPAVG